MTASDSIAPRYTFSRRLLVLLILLTLAFSTRLLPYSISSYPFNNDGVTEARIAGDILSSESLSYPIDSFYRDTYSVVTPVYNIALAFSASVLDVSPFSLSQTLVAMFSILTVLAGYVIALRISKSLVGALSTAMVLSLLGTFVYLSGSSWKGSLGVALLMLLTLAYINRSDKRYLALELLILAALPLTHHLVALLACMMLAYLTFLSLSVALARRNFRRQHALDLAILVAASVAAYIYYRGSSFERLSEFGSLESILLTSAVFLGLFFLAAVTLYRRKRTELTFAPVAGVIVAFFVFIDYSNPVFPYTTGHSVNILFLGLMYSVIVAFAWFGLEVAIRLNSVHKAIPLGLLLPVLTLLLFATISGFSLSSHKIFYRTFDFADLFIALGISVSIAGISKKRIRAAAVIGLLCILICTFPFAYITGPLVGIRHDTQQYEVDGMAWVKDHFDMPVSLKSDERLAYNARALFDFEKDPYLPSILVEGNLSRLRSVNLMLEEWTTVGVNDYPRGYTILDGKYIDNVLLNSDILFVGGPDDNNVVVFKLSIVATV